MKMSEKQAAQIKNNFTHHPPTQEQVEHYQLLREEGAHCAELFASLCPESRELSLAMTNLEQAVFWANAAIARNGALRELGDKARNCEHQAAASLVAVPAEGDALPCRCVKCGAIFSGKPNSNGIWRAP